MLALSEHRDFPELDERLRDASKATTELMSQILATGRRPSASARRNAKAARLECLIRAEAWTDAALALIDLELPQWQLRRIAYDGGEWHCALSRQRELPEWLDQSVEAHHADLPLAILSALVDARLVPEPLSRVSVPFVPREANPLYEPVLADNFA